MAQEPTADEIDAWNASSQPEDATTVAAATSTEAGLSHPLAADDSKETHAPDLKSPLSEEDFSAWDMPHDTNVVSPQDANTNANALTGNAPTSLDAAILDTQKSEQTTQSAPTDVPKLTETPEAPAHTLANGFEPVPSESAQPSEAPVEAALTSTETVNDSSAPVSSEGMTRRVHFDEQKDIPMQAEEKDGKEVPIAEQQDLPIESEQKVDLDEPVIDEAVQSDPREHSGVETAIAHVERTPIAERHFLPVEPEHKDDLTEPAIEETVQTATAEDHSVIETTRTPTQPETAEPQTHVEAAGRDDLKEPAIEDAAQDSWAIEITSIQPEYAEPQEPQVEAAGRDDLKEPAIEDAAQDPWAIEIASTQPEYAEPQDPHVEVAGHDDLQVPAVEEAPKFDVHEQAVPLMPTAEPTQLEPDVRQALPVPVEGMNGNDEFTDEHMETAVKQEMDLGAPATQTMRDQLNQPQTAQVEMNAMFDNQEPPVEAAAQSDLPEESTFNAATVEGNADGDNLWSNEAGPDVDSDGDDFFNQLKTQTKPIFAPPESESRFEEGVPLLDDTNPTSPPLPIPQRKSVDNPFGNEDHDGADFFTSIQNPHVSKELPIRHITRKSTTQVVESMGFDIDSPKSDISAAAQLDEVLKLAASGAQTPQALQEPQASQAPQAQPEAPEPSEEELAARWEAELSDVGEDDLAAQWEAALDDDDILLGDDVAPPVEVQSVLQSPMQPTTNSSSTGLISPFETPQSYARPRPALGVYTPHQPTTGDLMSGVPLPANGIIPPYFSQQPQNPVASRGESFAEASKEGYKSPYDLPDDLSRPRRPIATSKPAPPPVANTMPPPPSRDLGMMQPPVSSNMPPPAAPAAAPPPAPKNFFEELPLPAPRSRPASSGRYTPNPNAAAPTGPSHMPPPQNPYAAVPASAPISGLAPAPAPAPPAPAAPAAPAPAAVAPPPVPTNVLPAQSPLQPPERLEPYGSTLATSAPAGPSAASRYSPAPPSAQVPGKPPQLSRYSPAPPPAASARNRYASQPLSVPGQTHNLPFQPRTSSPLAYHEKVSYQPESAQQPQPPSLQPSVDLSPPRAQRSSLDQGSPYAPQLPDGPPNVVSQTAGPPVGHRQTPPPVTNRYAAQEYINEFAKRVTPTTAHASPAPPVPALSSPQATDAQIAPLRSQTQSPGQHITSPQASVPPISTLPRPASVHGSSSPTKTSNPYSPSQPSVQSRARAFSQRGLGFITPTDGQEHDALERWKGAPIFKFGFGGAALSCFPKHIPRYSAGQTAPMIMPSPGEIKTAPLNQWLPVAETIVQHPGPLKTKSKKKDLVSWLSSKIVAFENEPTPDFDLSHPESQRRHEERILLWKVMKILVENDGALEGSPAIEKSLRQAIFPHLPEAGPEGPYGGSFATSGSSFSAPSQPDAVDPQSVEQLRNHLLQGDREKAVWGAVDRRLWGHAMIVASTMDKSIWKQVVQEFIRREIRPSGGNTESLAALYEIFAGNIEESIDELVPPSARAGHQLISMGDGQGTTKNALDGLNSWRDTLGLVLSNRSSEDHQALLALGRLLASYGRTEAAHICFIFSRAAVFGGADDPQANIVLLGVDHQQFPSGLLSEDAFLLTEVYEYATAVLGNSPVANLPYLLAFKLLHAKQLADRGRTSEANTYCDAVAVSLKATTRPSPYYHQHLFIEVDELSARLRQTTTDGGSSWISKPSMERVSGSMWARFNSFVAGDDADPTSSGSVKPGETAEFGPFANVAGTPTVSRSPSVSDLYGSYPGQGAQSVPASASSRYMPSTQYAPTASPEQFRGRSSLDSQRSTSFGGMPVGQRRSSAEYPSPPVDSQTFQAGPMYGSPGSAAYQPTPPQTSYMPLAPVEEDASTHTQSQGDAAPPMQPTVNGLFYQPHGQDTSAVSQSPYYQGPPGMPQSDSPYMPQSDSPYMPPANGNAYAPPSYAPDINPASEEPEQPPMEEETQPKKKAFPDDDGDDLAARAAVIQKAENDRKADEAFRKAAEEDAKKDAQQQKKGWFGGWFGGGKKEAEHSGGGPIKAKLGEENSFYYDKDLKKWVNKKGPGSAEPVRATPPPPRGSAPPSRASSGSMAPPPPPGPPMSAASGSRPPSSSSDIPPSLSSSPAFSNLGVPPPTLGSLPRSVSTGATVTVPPGSGTSAPGPPRPTSLSHAQSIDDLLGAPTARKGNTVRGKKKGRYVDVMAK